MPRSQAQSDFIVVRREVTLPAQAKVIALEAASSEASEFTTRWVLRLTLVLLAAFAVLCAVGPHIPAGG